MPPVRLTALVLIAVLAGGWLVVDGTRAFITGNYFTARTGANAGQLGPWAKLVRAVGLDPRGAVMKSVHVLLGGAWLISAVLSLFNPAAGRAGLAASALLTLWYLPLGTLLSVVALALLFLPARGLS